MNAGATTDASIATDGGGRSRRRVGLVVAATIVVGALALVVLPDFGNAQGRQATALDERPVDAGRSEPRTDGLDPEEVWAPLDLMTVVDPGEHGAVGDGRADDTTALQQAIDGVPDGGGIVWLAPGRTFRTTDVIRITGDHVKVWSPNGQAEIRPSATIGERRHAVIIDGATGVGLFGPVFRSDGDRRRTALEDSTVVLDGARQTELVGLEITGSPSAAIFVFGASRDTWIVGNDLHDNWADAVHFTDGSRRAWVWDNVISNEGPTLGDDGIACVTYGGSDRCGSMEWWDNSYLGGGWGRGLAVVGGDTIHVHHNLVIDSAAAGILVASEPSYDTPGSDSIRIEDNVVCRAGHTVAHPGILLSGLDGAIRDVVVADNAVIDSIAGVPFRAEGDVIDPIVQGTSVVGGGRCEATTTETMGTARATSILTTRDASFVPEATRGGLAQIQVRPTAGGEFEQRLAYVVAGPRSAIDRWLEGRPGAATRFGSGDGESDRDEYVVLRTGSPLSVPESLRPVGFEELRAMTATQPDLWEHLDGGGR
ncbi:MAG: right-handed parallel beta-helix repeat-containing protein [Actinomycetota bacterium]